VNRDSILVTKDFNKDVNSAFGVIEFNTESEAYKQLKKHPEKYNFELGYIQSEVDPTQVVLYELSMVRKK
jgi:LAS superfamily LD-carboxypeptidase LdcB